MDTTHKKVYHVRDLGTQSVTLFPTRAQIVRKISELPLKFGVNEITIVGLTPTVDEHSIKVEGTGSAIISDIAVELLPNRDIFQDVYPESDDDGSDSSSDSEEDKENKEDEEEGEKENEEEAAVRHQLCDLRDEQTRAHELVSSAKARLHYLDAYGNRLNCRNGVSISDAIESYRAERERAFLDQMDGSAKSSVLAREIDRAAAKQMRLLKLKRKEKEQAAKVKAKIQKAKEREREKKSRQEAERLREKARVRKERESFWPRFCYSVRITLDAAGFTPMSSRRASVASDLVRPVVAEKAPVNDAEVDGAAVAFVGPCGLTLTYVTSSAFWSPSYDLQLSTTSSSAILHFDAQLTNATSETWTDCKVTLSTSQTTFSGLEDTISTLVPWRIKLAHKGAADLHENSLLNSREELGKQNLWHAKRQVLHMQKPRAKIFGVEPDQNHTDSLKGGTSLFKQPAIAPPFPDASFPIQQQRQAHMPNYSSILQNQQAMQAYQASHLHQGLLARNASPPPQTAPRGGGDGGAWEERKAAPGAFRGPFGDDRTVLEPQPEMDFQESSIEETGLTTAYDIPGLKTLPPRATATKQRVARISFANIVFSHTVIAKYKPVAYLKTKIRNTSKLTLLRGPTGLTLDGSFMGRTSLPRCSAGDHFSMNLGVDPAIEVVYPKPDVRRATTGLFSKEDSSVYTRAVTIANTRASVGKPVKLMVLDQVPVSEDERLKVEVMTPQGITVGAAGVPAGISGRDSRNDKDWGKATASLKKGGEVCWDVTLNGGKAVKLALEYVVGMPSGDFAVQC